MSLLKFAAVLIIGLAASSAAAQDAATDPAPLAAASSDELFDTSYRPSPSVSARLTRKFLQDIRWSSGVELRDSLAEAFAEKSPTEIWQELVAQDGLAADNVTDALTAYWVINWITANAAYGAVIDHAPIQRQLAAAFAQDRKFLGLSGQKRQELAEGYMLEFLLQHAALNNAVNSRDTSKLYALAMASVERFRQKTGVNLLRYEPGPDGFQPKKAN